MMEKMDRRKQVNGMDEVLKEGLFVPNTMDGNILADGVSASYYTSAVNRMWPIIYLRP